MYVIKRNGSKEEVMFDKIYQRIKMLSGLNQSSGGEEPLGSFPGDVLLHVNPHSISQHVIQGLYDGINTTDIDNYSAAIATSLSIKHYDYGTLAARIIVSNHHKNTLTGFRDKMTILYMNKDNHQKANPIISSAFYKFVKKNQVKIEAAIDYDRDYLLDFFAFKTLEKLYLLYTGTRTERHIIERPQDLFMRVAIFIHAPLASKARSDNPTSKPASEQCLQLIFETYDYMSKNFFTHATPTLFNAGLVKPSMLSCFLLSTEDSLEGIMKTATDCAHISKNSGGIGVAVSNWRSEDSLIRSSGGKSSGTVPFLRILNNVARAFNQGGGKRLGSIACYMEPHHPDILAFLNLKRNHGDESLRARDLFLALWVSDLFMQRVQNNEDWSLFDPDHTPGLSEVYGDEYNTLYLDYEKRGMAHRVVKARAIWQAVFNSQKESGVPYICYKDTVNRYSSQKNVGTIKSSNLCAEIMEYSSTTEYACCTLASICLSKFVQDSAFNYQEFRKVVDICVKNLNKVIDKNHYPVPETKKSNFRHRPLAIGVQGLHDVFFKFKWPFSSPEAAKFNRYLFEVFYFQALTTSNLLARELYEAHVLEATTGTGSKYAAVDDIPLTIGAYSSFSENGGCPLSKGIFHFEIKASAVPALQVCDLRTKDELDWEGLRSSIVKYGVRNSLLIALMPTASTSQVMGNVEGMEPLTSNLYKRPTLAGEFIVINKYLMRDLQDMGLYDEDMERELKIGNGSIQHIEMIPKTIRDLYKTTWELSQKTLIDLAADRTPFIDQSQSLNLYIEDLTFAKFNSMHFYGWSKGLKTGCYYLRSRSASRAQTFTIEPSNQMETAPEECVMCSS
jgi:ribonucleoside-diphosphate reductase alpha subunit